MATLGRQNSLHRFNGVESPEPLTEPMMALNLTQEQVTELLTFWQQVDANGDNFVDVVELDAFLGAIFPEAPSDLVLQVRNVIMTAADRNGDGKIDVGEFVALLQERREEAVALGLLPPLDNTQLNGLGAPPPPVEAAEPGAQPGVVPRIISQLTGEEIDMIRDCFIFLDTNGDGFVDMAELMAGVQAVVGPRFAESRPYITKIFEVADKDQDNRLSLTEFLASFADGPGAVPHEVVLASVSRVRVRLSDEDIANLQEAFVSIDRNKDGYIDRQELRAALKKVLDGKVNETSYDDIVNVVIATADADHDGRLNLSEFIRSFQEDQGVLPAAFVGYRAKAVQRRLTPEQLVTLRETFEDLDRNHDGFVDYKELFDALNVALRSVLDEAEIEALANDIMFTADRNKDQKLTLTEFIKNFQVNEDLMVIPIAAVLERREQMRQRLEELVQNGDVRRMIKVFDAIDRNHDGYLEPSEVTPIVAAAIAESYPELSADTVQEVAAIILSEADSDGDGRLSLAEFVESFVKGYGVLPLDRVREVAQHIRRRLSEDERQVVVRTFQTMDRDRDGFVSRKELFDALQSALAPSGTPVETIIELTNFILSTVDVDDDGRISLREFILSFELDQDVLPVVSGDAAPQPVAPPQPVVVGVTVISANDLLRANTNTMVQVLDGTLTAWLNVPARDIRENSHWNASENTVRLTVCDHPEAPAAQRCVVFDVWESANGTSAFLGRAVLSAAEILSAGPAHRTLPLRPRDNEPSDEVYRAPSLGSVTVSCFVSSDKPTPSKAHHLDVAATGPATATPQSATKAVAPAAPPAAAEPVAERPKSPVAQTLEASSPTTATVGAIVVTNPADTTTPAKQSTGKAVDPLKSPIPGDVSGCFITDNQLRHEFSKYDADGSGVLNKEEFRKAYLAMEFFGRTPSVSEFEREYKKIATRDGFVSFDEFCIFMLKRSRM